ncbi:MAG: AAA family ATPase [bacterium]|nr:AAA family ATPase [bacterium]
MKKILILGSCGAGKSTLARKMQSILDIEIIHLDQHYWKPNWTKTESEEWEKKVEELIKGERWIIDGNYRSTLDIRLPQSDTVIWLDFPRMTCLRRLLKRRLKKNRVDEISGCKERISFNLLKWVLWKFPRDNRKDIIKRLETIRKEKNVFVLKSDRDVDEFLNKLKK